MHSRFSFAVRFAPGTAMPPALRFVIPALVGLFFVAPLPAEIDSASAETAFEVRSTLRYDLPEQRLTIHRVKNPRLSGPVPLAPSSEPGSANAVATHQDGYDEESTIPVSQLLLSATVVEERATLLVWRHEGRDYRAWSNLDFNDLLGFSDFERDGRRYFYFLALGNASAADLASDPSLRIPAALPFGDPAFVLMQGDPHDNRATEGIAALHAFYRNEGFRLRQARIEREREERERAAALRANPPVPKDIVLHYWKVQPARTEGGAR